MTDKEIKIIEEINKKVNNKEMQDLLKELNQHIDKMAIQTMRRIDVIEKILIIKDKIIQKQDEKIKKQKQENEEQLEELRYYVLEDDPNISVPNAYGIGMENYKDEELEEIEKLKEKCNAIFKEELDL